jgi:hypothetical protein
MFTFLKTSLKQISYLSPKYHSYWVPFAVINMLPLQSFTHDHTVMLVNYDQRSQMWDITTSCTIKMQELNLAFSSFSKPALTYTKA